MYFYVRCRFTPYSFFLVLHVVVVVKITFHCCLLNCNVILFDFLITVRVLIKVFFVFPSFKDFSLVFSRNLEPKIIFQK